MLVFNDGEDVPGPNYLTKVELKSFDLLRLYSYIQNVYLSAYAGAKCTYLELSGWENLDKRLKELSNKTDIWKEMERNAWMLTQASDNELCFLWQISDWTFLP